MHRLLIRFTTAGIIAAAFAVLPSLSAAADEIADRPATLQPPARSSAEAFSQDSAPVGLRRPASELREHAGLRNRIELPFGLNYNRDSRSLLMQLDEKNEWGVGLNLNVAAPPTELSAPGLQLAPKRTPGLMLHRNF